VPLTGTGTAAVAAAAPTSLSFGNQLTNTTSAAQVVTVVNTGNANLVVSGVTFTGADPTSFAPTTTCTTVAPGGACTVSVRFAPTTAGAKAATLNITSNASNSPATVAVSGTGVAPAPAIAVSSASLAFGNQTTNTTSAARTITVSNTGTASLAAPTVTKTGTDAALFTVVNGCTAALPAGGSCTISVTFRPTTVGAKSASVSIAHTAPNAASPILVGLTGTGTPPPTTASVAGIAFGAKAAGSTTTKDTTVTNTGTAPLIITGASIAPTTGFTVTLGTCTAAVQPGKTCKLSVSFRPVAATASYSSTLKITSNASNTPSATLTGTRK
jgi:hypothetical protein